MTVTVGINVPGSSALEAIRVGKLVLAIIRAVGIKVGSSVVSVGSKVGTALGR